MAETGLPCTKNTAIISVHSPLNLSPIFQASEQTLICKVQIELLKQIQHKFHVNENHVSAMLLILTPELNYYI